MSRIRNYVFTINNHTFLDVQSLLQHTDDAGNDKTKLIRYFTMQEEIGESGTHHLQGYMELYRAFTIRALRRRLTIQNIHLEPRRGSQLQAIVYAQKDDTRDPHGHSWTVGNKKRESGRNAIEMILSGKKMKKVARENPKQFVRSFRGLQALRHQLADQRNWPMEVIIYFGVTGCGKSYKAYKDFPDAYTAPWPSKGGVWWWPAYDGEETVILDEFREQISFSTILTLMDRYAFNVQQKGGYMAMTSRRLVITTNLDPVREWYMDQQDRSPFLRRLRDFAKIYDFGPLVQNANGTITTAPVLRDPATYV